MSKVNYHDLLESDKVKLRNIMRKWDKESEMTDAEIDNHIAGSAFICGSKDLKQENKQ